MPRLGSVRVPLSAIGPKTPRWGERPRPPSRDQGRWDPKPALGLAMRPAAASGRRVGGRSRWRSVSGTGLPLARVRVGGLGEMTVEAFGWPEMDVNFRTGLPQGFHGKSRSAKNAPEGLVSS